MNTHKRQMTFFEECPWAKLPQILGVTVDNVEYRLRLLHTGREAAGNEPRPFQQTHAHDVYHVLFYTNAQGKISIDSQMVELKNSSLVMTSPGQQHHFYPRNSLPFEYLEITFCQENAAGKWLQSPFHKMLGLLVGRELQPPELPIHCSPNCGRRIQSILELFPKFQKDLTDAHVNLFAANLALAELFHTLLAEDVMIKKAEHDSNRQNASQLAVAQSYLDANYSKKIDIDEVAAQAKLSARHLQRLFKQTTGTTITDYIVSCRIRHAKLLLRESGLRIQEIADRLGFASAYYFSTVFKRRTGKTPSDYRSGAKK